MDSNKFTPTEFDQLAFTAYADIANEVDDMMDALKDYRKVKAEHGEVAVRPHLFRVHSYENKIKRLLKEERMRQGIEEPKTKHAS